MMDAQKIDSFMAESDKLGKFHPVLDAKLFDEQLKRCDEMYKALTEDEKKVIETRRAVLAQGLVAPTKLVDPPDVIRLDLACGQNCREGFQGVDLPGTGAHIDAQLAELRAKSGRTVDDDKLLLDLEKAKVSLKHEFNLLRFPWPWQDSSVTEIHCSHFIEHIPTEFVDEHGNYVPCGTPGSKDLFFKFFDEVYRILKPGGLAQIITPNARNNRAFQDPTHRRFIVAETFFYLFSNFRKINKLDHYNVVCDFDGNVGHTVDNEFNVRDPEVQQRQLKYDWNVVHDWVVTLKSNKKA